MNLSVYLPLKTQKQFLKLITANIINRFGDAIDAIAFSWAMYRITGSASLMALIIGLNFVPTVLLQPVAGALVDRIRKRRVMVLSDIGRGFVVLAVVAALVGGWATPLLLAVVTLLNSSLEALRVPAGSAFTPLILDNELYTVGTALNSSLSRVSEVAGLLLAGIVVAWFGTEGALLIDAATFFSSAIIIGFIRVQESIEKAKVRVRDVLNGFSEGMKYLKPQKLLVAMLFTGMMMNFLMVPVSVFATAYVADFLHAGAEVLSLIEVLLLIGIALGSFLTPLLKRFRNKPLFIAAGLGSSLALACFWIVPDINGEPLRFTVLVIVDLIFGFCVGIQNVIFSSSFLRIVPKEYLGRIGGLSNAILCLVMPVGSFLCSAAAAAASVPLVLLISGVFSLGLYLSLIRVKTLREL